jgi:hypothetical protein
MKDNWDRLVELSKKPNKTDDEKSEWIRRLRYHNAHVGDVQWQ